MLVVLLIESRAFAGAGWVIEPLTLSTGVRASVSDQLQIDGLIRPVLGATRETRTVDIDFPLTDPETQTATVATFGGTFSATVRVGLQPTPSRATVSAGGWTRVLGIASETGGGLLPTTLGGWFGAGAEHRLAERWSVGMDLELVGVSTSSTSDTVTTGGIDTTTTTSALSGGLLTGAHIWLTLYPRGSGADSTSAPTPSSELTANPTPGEADPGPSAGEPVLAADEIAGWPSIPFGSKFDRSLRVREERAGVAYVDPGDDLFEFLGLRVSTVAVEFTGGIATAVSMRAGADAEVDLTELLGEPSERDGSRVVWTGERIEVELKGRRLRVAVLTR